MASLKAADVILTVDDGGAEDGSPSAASSPETITCTRQNYEENFEAVTTPDFGRCDTYEINQYVRARGTLRITIPLSSAGVASFGEAGTALNKYKYITRKFTSSGSTKTFLCAMRSNTISAQADERVMQTVVLEIQGIS
jgi:hypothetical protein